ncbi:helix-turn-helix transcriptional regulator [Promicromonospora sp. NPDC050262]|uniref:helix-turn-helix transcriptional regulator n=1 Tax=Promicromonospora sp. NPDC050262 TaxID=3155036 RepID=UPI0033E59C02
MAIRTTGQFVRERREELGLSRERFAVETEVSVSTVVRLENHDQLPRVPALIRIAAGLRCSLDEIAGVSR